MNYYKALEIKLGRYINPLEVVIFYDKPNDIYIMEEWNIPDEPVTIEQLEELYTRNETSINRIHELNSIIVNAGNTLQRVLLDNTYDIFGSDIANIIQSASDEIRELEQEKNKWMRLMKQ